MSAGGSRNTIQSECQMKSDLTLTVVGSMVSKQQRTVTISTCTLCRFQGLQDGWNAVRRELLDAVVILCVFKETPRGYL